MTTRFYDTMVGLAPLHWWRFHEASAAGENDIGSDPDSEFTGSSGTITSQTAGPLEATETTYSVTFSSGSYITRSKDWSSGDFAGTSDGSVVFWFKTSSSGSLQFIIGQHPSSYAFTFYITATGEMLVQAINNFIGGSRTITSTTGGYNDGNWHLFALTCDGAAANRMYIDGAEISYTAATTGTGLTDYFWLQPATSGHFRVAQSPRYPTAPYDYPFTGSLSELAFFSYPLTASDVYSLWDATQTAAPPSPGTGGHRYKGRKTFVGF